MKISSPPKNHRAVELIWSHLGVLHRVTAWPDLAFARQVGRTWQPFEPDPSDAAFGSAAITLDDRKWNQFLEFVPPPERAFMSDFKFGRLAALVILHRCPELRDELAVTPALATFLAIHVSL